MSEQIRNFSLCGHSGAGKTALAEAMLFNMGVVNRLGRISDGTTASDYDSGEKQATYIKVHTLQIEKVRAFIT